MPFTLPTNAKRAIAAAAVMLPLTAPAIAQQQTAPQTLAQAGQAAAASDNPWVKICNTDQQSQKEICLITQELRADTGQFLASVAIREIKGEQRRLLLNSVPVGMLIQPGLQLQVDNNKAIEAKYTICFPNACYAETAFDNDAFIQQMKAGGKLRITALNQQAKPVRFEMTLVGFTAAYDGEGLNPQQLAQQQRALQEELNRKAEAARQRLIEEQRKASDAARAN